MNKLLSFLKGILSGEEKVKDFKSPYLKNPERLADIIAALQAMGAYPFASRKIESWEGGLDEPLSADKWSLIFKEHPEFFRIDNDQATLRWRHAYDRNYHTKDDKELNADEVKSILEDEKKNNKKTILSRKPLMSDQIETLIKTAIEMHSRAIALQQERRWWVPLVAGLVGAIIGLLIR